ncbi:MAG: DUF4286 family protein [Chryseobacterium sp.]|nr:MAG: DUF4286 family protein [Chryseobacterium sp.]
MSILSITFHVENQTRPRWDSFLEAELPQLIDRLPNVERFIFSAVDSEMLNEGSNFNLLLIFDDERARQDFREDALDDLVSEVEKRFGQTEVMTFVTQLNRLLHRF